MKNFIKVCLSLVTQLCVVQLTFAVDYSRPAFQKCEDNRLGTWNKEIEVPGHRMSTDQVFSFRVTEKCATKLPHCLKGCGRAMTQVALPLQNISELSDPFNAPQFHFTPHGYLRYESEYFSPDDYCVHSFQESLLVLKVCPSNCGGASNSNPENSLYSYEVCVPKCCSIHKVIDLESDSCQYSGTKDPWLPLVYRSESKQVCGEKRTNLKISYVQSPPMCSQFQKYLLKNIPGRTRVRFRLLTNGTLLLRDISEVQWTVIEGGTYCLDGVQNYGDSPSLYSGEPGDQVLLHCIDEAVVSNESEHSGGGKPTTRLQNERLREDRMTLTGILYILLLFSGVPFLLVTAIIYVLVWGRQNVHGWTIFSHTLAMLLHYVAQGVANTVSRILNSDQNASSLCKFVGISNHFFVLASFFWLTIINYDLFSMFRHLKTTVGRSRGMRRFMAYMGIAWGIPLVVVVVSVVLDQLYGLYGDDGDCETDVIVPLYGHKTCYMVEDARPYYLYYPVGVLMGVNLGLAVMTFANMYKHERNAKVATAENKVKHRRKFKVLAKLFVVMGLVFVFEVVVFLQKPEWEVLPWYLIFPDVFNAFQAVAIFLLFACQPKILKQVEDAHPKLTPITKALKSIRCNGRSTTKGSSVSPPASTPMIESDVDNGTRPCKV